MCAKPMTGLFILVLAAGLGIVGPRTARADKCKDAGKPTGKPNFHVEIRNGKKIYVIDKSLILCGEVPLPMVVPFAPTPSVSYPRPAAALPEEIRVLFEVAGIQDRFLTRFDRKHAGTLRDLQAEISKSTRMKAARAAHRERVLKGLDEQDKKRQWAKHAPRWDRATRALEQQHARASKALEAAKARDVGS